MRVFGRKPLEQAELEKRLVLLRTALDRRVHRLEARLLRRRQALERALSEFKKTLEHLEALAQEGRYPGPYLDPALERERLRTQQAEEELGAIREKLASTRARLLAEARHKAARLGAKEEHLDRLFPKEEA
ncbi:MAG: hypothetical protein C4327_14505 [Meiothermus sp.]